MEASRRADKVSPSKHAQVGRPGKFGKPDSVSQSRKKPHGTQGPTNNNYNRVRQGRKCNSNSLFTRLGLQTAPEAATVSSLSLYERLAVPLSERISAQMELEEGELELDSGTDTQSVHEDGAIIPMHLMDSPELPEASESSKRLSAGVPDHSSMVLDDETHPAPHPPSSIPPPLPPMPEDVAPTVMECNGIHKQADIDVVTVHSEPPPAGTNSLVKESTPVTDPQSSVFDQCRSLLLPLIVKNAKLRGPSIVPDNERMEQNAKSLLDDNFCYDFVENSKEYTAQMSRRQDRLIKEEPPDPAVYDPLSVVGTKRAWEGVQDEPEWRPRKRPFQSNSVLQSKEESPVTLVESPRMKPPPKAPRAMLQLQQVHSNKRVPDVSERLPERWLASQIAADNYSDPDLPSPNLDQLSPPSSKRATRFGEPHRVISGVPHLLDEQDDRQPFDGDKLISASGESLPLPQHDPHPDQINMPPVSSCRVPGLWFYSVGGPHAEVLESSFDIDPEIAAATQRWNRRRETFDPDASHAYVELACLPKDLAIAVLQRLGEGASPEDIVKVIAKIPPRWPTRGTLVVDLNRGKHGEMIWLGDKMDSTSPPLNFTPYIQAGMNRLRIVQLEGMTQYLFVLRAFEPSAEDLETARIEDQEKRDFRRYWKEFEKKEVPNTTGVFSIPTTTSKTRQNTQ